ncbi:hypothetical protein G6F46_005450 [Rhizopus delemar]|uniref:PH domain-containing protein n=2 Tax=Rhizopus TaxID=4842 RepID=A0A9P6Z4R3_9FUNG|nr:hypothetical protein G6F54_012405 [Rhizopus delemar]KAG1549598.1 hypothetical protein G6F51_002966 [Rhizopus arrhizus]KAG1512660.1 hypothetical protein G6F53_005022 [Rhizopus delemar]KAG1520394.1 hypothetical protein G6F52_007706 [Rhizopus delemar]KAG1559251.1 hypothetical protein G6F49_003768 [Rhizopus delemar]
MNTQLPLAELPLETLNLDRILEIIPQREPLCFQLKLVDSSWMIRCESESDVKLWIRAIEDRKRNKSTSLLKRRNKQLTPIIITQQQSNYSLITPSLSTSSSSLILSPPNLNTRVPPCAIDNNKEGNNLIIEEDELSPTYLIYKKRFRL